MKMNTYMNIELSQDDCKALKQFLEAAEQECLDHNGESWSYFSAVRGGWAGTQLKGILDQLDKLKWGQELSALIPMGVPSKITPEIQEKLDEGQRRFGYDSNKNPLTP
jgi:hypothetical protein